MTIHHRAQRKIRVLYPSVFCLITVFFILLSINSESVYASAIGEKYPSIYEDTALKHTVLRGIDLTIRERYETADSIFADLAKRYPKSPIGPLFRAAVLETKMLDQEDGRVFSRLERRKLLFIRMLPL